MIDDDEDRKRDRKAKKPKCFEKVDNKASEKKCWFGVRERRYDKRKEKLIMEMVKLKRQRKVRYYKWDRRTEIEEWERENGKKL